MIGNNMMVACKRKRGVQLGIDDGELAIITCPICYDPFDPNYRPPMMLVAENSSLQCQHIFCKQCLDSMIHTRGKKCPICRVQYEKANISILMVNMMKVLEGKKDNQSKSIFGILEDSKNSNSYDKLREYMHEIGLFAAEDLEYLDHDCIYNITKFLKTVKAEKFRRYYYC